MGPEDTHLVAQSQNGDLRACNAIVERYQGRTFSLVARMLGDQGHAEDVTQETFVAAYRAIGRFRGGSLRAWIFRIASNLSIDFIRSNRRRPEDSLDESLLKPAFQPPSHEESPEQHALRGELGTAIHRAILTLPQDQRATLVMVDVQGLSYEEASQATGASLGTVKSRMNRARARVRDSLMQQPELLPDRFRP